MYSGIISINLWGVIPLTFSLPLLLNWIFQWILMISDPRNKGIKSAFSFFLSPLPYSASYLPSSVFISQGRKGVAEITFKLFFSLWHFPLSFLSLSFFFVPRIITMESTQSNPILNSRHTRSHDISLSLLLHRIISNTVQLFNTIWSTFHYKLLSQQERKGWIGGEIIVGVLRPPPVETGEIKPSKRPSVFVSADIKAKRFE